MLVTIEGVDGSGKTSVVNHLKTVFKDYDILFTREPYDEDMRDAIERNEGNAKRQLLLFLLDHYNHQETVIEPALKEQRVIISDRYIDSCIAYQSVALNTSIESIEKYHKNSIYPHLTILLYGDVPTFVWRTSNRKWTVNMFADILTQRAIQAQYINLVKKYKNRFIIINAELPFDIVCRNVETVINNCLEMRGIEQ